MLSNAYFLAKFRFDTAENEAAKNLQNFANFASGWKRFRMEAHAMTTTATQRTTGRGERPQAERGCQLKERIVGACKIFKMFRDAARLVGSGHVFGLCAKLGEFLQNSANIQKISASFN